MNNQTPTKTELIKELNDKYFNLVWLARKHPEDFKNQLVHEQYQRIEEQYPQEVDDLLNANTDWHHGFNSGMLACLRLIGTGRMTMQKIVEFPELDT